jgi:predicted lipoprotein
MFKKRIKPLIVVVVILVVAYNSVYFKKLSDVKAANTSQQFNAALYAQDYLTKKLPSSLKAAMDLNTLTTLLQTAPEKTFQQHSHALGIGNIRYFLVKGEGQIVKIEDDATLVQVKKDSTSQVIRIATEYVFGNAIRDASGLVNINEFNNTMDFNNVSAEINKVIRQQVLPPFKAKAKLGDVVQFTGAIELNQAHVKLDNLEVVPITLKIINRP